MQARFQVKIRTNDSIRRDSFPEAPTWESFKSHVISQIIHTCNLQPDNIILRLEYIDDENDTVTISSEEEWKEMLNQKHNSTLVTLFLKGWETIPKEGEVQVPVRPAAENIEELNRREEEALQEIRRIMELQTENKRKEEERKFQDFKRLEEEELIRLAEEELMRYQEHKHKEEERKLLEERKKKEEEQQRKLLLEEQKNNEEKLKRKEEKLKLKEEIKRRAEEIKRKEEETRRKVEELKRERKRRDEIKREEEKIKEEKRQKAAILHQQNAAQIKKHQDNLAKLHEFGFRDHKRNLHLLITFNGNIDSVIDNLIAQ
jgi:hypothetical protein